MKKKASATVNPGWSDHMVKQRRHQKQEGQALVLFPEPSARTQRVPLDLIDPERQPWQVRRSTPASEVAALRRALDATRVSEPLRLVKQGERLKLLSGRLLFEAALQRRSAGGPDWVMAEVMPPMRPEELLRLAIMLGEVRFQYSIPELGWALGRLRHMLANGTEDVTQRDLAGYLGLDYRKWKSRISEALTAAERLPQADAEALARHHGCSLDAIVSQKRAVWRELVRAESELAPPLREVLGEAVAAGRPVVKDLSQARQALVAPEAREAARAALHDGRSVRAAVCWSSENNPFEVKLGIWSRWAVGLGRALRWLRMVLGASIARVARLNSSGAADPT